MTLRNFIGKSVKWILVAFLFVVLLEVWARFDDWLTWDAPFTGIYSHEILRVADATGFHNRPNAKFQKWEINQFGFRGPDITKEKPAGVTRVIVVGASETFGLHEGLNMDYPSQMQTMLDSLYPGKFEIINSACVGMTPPRIAHYYRTWLAQFEPDIIMYYPSPSFYLDEDVPPDSADWVKLSAWRPAHEWRVVGKAKIVLKSFIPMSWQLPIQRWQLNRQRANKPADYVFEHIPPERLVTYRRHVTELIETVRQNGTAIIVATHVSRFGDTLTTEDERHLRGAIQFFPRASEQAFLEIDSLGNAQLRSLATEMNVPLIDLTRILPHRGEYFADASHFTEAGARIVANAFVDELLQWVESQNQMPTGVN